jgi:lipoprotein NlpD
VCCLLLVACSSGALNWPTGYHVVRQGDTLFSIAWRYDLDYRELAAWNKLGDGTLIYEGQVISLAPVANSGAQPPAVRQAPVAKTSGKALPVYTPPPEQKVAGWQWPTQGRVVEGYQQSIKTDSGIHIAGSYGQPVQAASSGTVVYAGNALKGYGNLLIIKHNDTYLSAYGFNSELLVREGDLVTRGQRVALMGQTPAQQVLLHFEIRKDGQPVNPLTYLPRS